MTNLEGAGRPPAARRSHRRLTAALALLALAAGALAAAAYAALFASLPAVRGEIAVAGLSAPVEVARDRRGVPSLRGESRRDVAFAAGFVHAQERFFQMDLLRRQPAGELAEIFGARALPADRAVRPHRLRARAERVLRQSPPEIRDLLAAYAAGANAGLAALGSRPFEYFALRTAPQPWRPEDCVLVVLGMFLLLEDGAGANAAAATLMHDVLPPRLAEFLMPPGTEWDAPLAGPALVAPPPPGPETIDLRHAAAGAPAAGRAAAGGDSVLSWRGASNAWAVAGSAGAGGRALLADELHLDLAVPNLWYQAALSWPDPAAGGWTTVTGAMLPGLPALVVGSNGRVAWGVTNSALATTDLVRLDLDPHEPDAYRTPDGTRRFEHHRELLRVHGGDIVPLDAVWTIWGPVVGKDLSGRPLALRWVVDEDGGVDLSLLGLADTRDLGQAIALAHRSGAPALNLIAADAAGHIAWTILGRLPRRANLAGRWAESWAAGDRGWRGLLPPDAVPAVIDPPAGRLWAANSRMLPAAETASLGGGDFQLGARPRQIRDDLLALGRPVTRDDMRRIQLDDRALFLARWHDHLLGLLSGDALAGHPGRQELRRLVDGWGAEAAVSSAGYRMVRSYRLLLARELFAPLIAPCIRARADFDYLDSFPQYEGPLWQLVRDQPAHLLSPRYKSWREAFLAAADAVVALYGQAGGALATHTWGERNTTEIRHLLSFPGPGRWLDMPAHALPGADDMPRVQEPSYGPSVRLVVSPGAEREGTFNMPCGESGNPLSRHYRDANADWERDSPSPLLPGPPVARLRLVPAPAAGAT